MTVISENERGGLEEGWRRCGGGEEGRSRGEEGWRRDSLRLYNIGRSINVVFKMYTTCTKW